MCTYHPLYRHCLNRHHHQGESTSLKNSTPSLLRAMSSQMGSSETRSSWCTPTFRTRDRSGLERGILSCHVIHRLTSSGILRGVMLRDRHHRRHRSDLLGPPAFKSSIHQLCESSSSLARREVFAAFMLCGGLCNNLFECRGATRLTDGMVTAPTEGRIQRSGWNPR